MAAGAPAGGYPRSRFDEPRIQADFECPICSDIVRDATDCGHGHIFCRVCLTDAVAQAPRCPLCQKPCRVGTFLAVPFVDRQIMQLRVKCAREACNWRAPLAEQVSGAGWKTERRISHADVCLC